MLFTKWAPEPPHYGLRGPLGNLDTPGERLQEARGRVPRDRRWIRSLLPHRGADHFHGLLPLLPLKADPPSTWAGFSSASPWAPLTVQL